MILALLQARMSSKRLPGKVMLPILGRPVLELQIERVLRSKWIDKLVVVTSTNTEDNCIEQLCGKLNIACFRGSLDNVLSRFYHAAAIDTPDHVVRLTGDCPVCDPDIIDAVIAYHIDHDFDYTSNILELTYPDGLDVEVFKYDLLKQAYENTKTDHQQEHVTPYMRDSSKFKLGSYKSKADHSEQRWTLDQSEDYEVIKDIFENLYPNNPDFNYVDILSFIEQKPYLVQLNAQYRRNNSKVETVQ